MQTICLIPGDGIGPEVIGAAADILSALDLPLKCETYSAGWSCFEKTGKALPEETLAAVKSTGYALFGATSSPSGGAPGYRSPILELRQDLNLFANLRPLRSLPIPAARPDIDLLIVRENTEGLYVRRERWETPDTAIAERVITRAASQRIAQVAVKKAARRRGRLTIAHKANVLTKTDGLFLETARKVAAEFGGLEVEDRLVDALAHELVLTPERFDVILAPNLYGDILSDLASALVGGLGVAASVNVGDSCAVYEPVHGSAPDIAGQGIANPSAALLSLALMLDDLQFSDAATRIRSALTSTLQAGICTPDLGGDVRTTDMIAAITARL